MNNFFIYNQNHTVEWKTLAIFLFIIKLGFELYIYDNLKYFFINLIHKIGSVIFKYIFTL